MENQKLVMSVGTMADDVGSPTAASFRPKDNGFQAVTVSLGSDETINSALLGLPAVLSAYGGLELFMYNMSIKCAGSGFSLPDWVAAVRLDVTLNTTMQNLIASDGYDAAIKFMAQKSLAYSSSTTGTDPV